VSESAQTPPRRWLTARSRSLGGSLIASGTGQLLLTVSGVLVARGLGPEDRGYLALLVVVSGICVILGSAGLPTALTYYVARDPLHAGRIVRSLVAPTLIQVAVTAIVQLGVLFAFVRHDPPRVKVAAVISILLVPGILSQTYGLALLQGQQRFRPFNTFRVLPTALYVVVVLVIFLLGVADLIVLMTAWVAALLVGGLFALGVALRGLPPADAPGGPSRPELTKFGLKSLVGAVSPIEALRLDQALVGLLLAPVSLGLYVVAQAFTNLPRVVAMSIGMIAYPHVASQPDAAVARRAMWRYFLLGVLSSVLVIGVLEAVTGELVGLFFGSEFAEATPIARILLLATLFMAARRVLTDGVNGMGRPGLGTTAEIASWVLLVPTIAILLPRYGVEGVALALAISWFASLLFLIVLVLASESRWFPAGGDSTRLDFPSLRRRRAPRRLESLNSRAVLTWGLVFAAALGGGVTVAVAPARASLGIIAALLAALVVALGRSAFARHAHVGTRLRGNRRWVEPTESESDEPGDDDFRTARVLFYAGILLLGFLTLRVGGQVTPSDVLFLFSFLLACAAIIILRRKIHVWVPGLLLLGIGLFSLGGAISTFGASEPIKSGAVVARIVVLTIFWFWLGAVVLTRSAHLKRATTLWLLSAALTGAAGVLQLLAGDVIPGTAPVFGRSTGFTGQPNELGGITAIAFIPAVTLATRAGLSGAQRVGSLLVLGLITGGLIASGSVGAFLAVGAAMFIWFALQRPSLSTWIVFAGIATAVIGFTTVQELRGAPTPVERLSRVTGTSATATALPGAGSLESRISTYRVALARIADDPFVGVGLDLVSTTKPFGIVSYEYEVHNLVIGIWYKAGLLGLTGMLITLLAIFRAGWVALIRSRSEDEYREVAGLMSAVVAFVVFSMSEPILFARYGWVPSALILAFGAVQERRREPAVSSGLKISPAQRLRVPRPARYQL
jgi:O-antigen/teichoic acid export membrane protein/O-antigen ligase